MTWRRSGPVTTQDKTDSQSFQYHSLSCHLTVVTGGSLDIATAEVPSYVLSTLQNSSFLKALNFELIQCCASTDKLLLYLKMQISSYVSLLFP